MKTGEVIASYQLEARLGEDDSRAWRARHMVSGQLFRLDLWPITVEAPAYIRAMKAIASLRHQFISSILEFGVHDGELGWTVTHLVSGPTLQERIHERGRPPYRAGLELCFAVARALESAHGHGVYHGQLLLGSCVWADDRILLTGWGQVHIDEAAKLEAGKADIDFMGVLTSTMTETPPAPVRALIDTPPKTSGAYRRALAAALGAVASSDPSTLVPSPTLEATSETAGHDDATVETSYPIPQVPSTAFGSEPPDSTLRSDQGSDVDPICETDEHRPENLAALQGWNVSAEKQPEWLDEDRNEIRESNQYAAPTGEDSWGVGAPPETPKEMNRAGQELPSGMRIHTVHEGAALHPTRNASKTSSFGGLILLVGLPVVAAGLWLAFREPGVDPPKTQDVVSVKSTTSGTKVKLEVSGVPDSTVSTDAHRITADAKIEPGVSRRFELRSSVPVTVRRTKDKKVVCQESETCSLPIYTDSVKTIDTNYTVTHPKYMPKEVNGYDIYDLRSKGYMRIVMAPKEKPVSKKRKKRRRKAK